MSNATTQHGEDRAFKGKVTLFAIAAAVGGFLFGFDSSVINGAVDAIKGEFDLSEGASGFAVASALIGCAFGAYFAGRLADRWGRTRVMFWAAVLFFVSSIGSGFAFATWDFVIWRLVGGLGIAPRRSSPGVHLRGLPEGDPRSSGVVPAARDHARHLRGAALRPVLRRHGGQRVGRGLRAAGVALDVPRRCDPSSSTASWRSRCPSRRASCSRRAAPTTRVR